MPNRSDDPTFDQVLTGAAPFGLVCAECASWIAQNISAETIDLIITSPPYDLMRDYKGYTFNFEAIAQQCYRVLKPDGVMVWIVTDETVKGQESLNSFRQALYFQELGFLVETMISAEEGTGAKGSKLLYWQAHEYMFVLKKSQRATFNPIYDRRNKYGGQTTSGQRRKRDGATRKEGSRKILEFGRRTNIWQRGSGGDQGDAGHPAPLDYKTAHDHIISWSNPGDVVLDPMCGGSANALNACLATGRRFWGIDMGAAYIEETRSRVKMPLLVVS